MKIVAVDKTTAPKLLEQFYLQNTTAAKIGSSLAVKPGKARDRVEKVIEALKSMNFLNGFVALDGDLVVGAVSYRTLPVKYFAELYTNFTDKWSNDSGDCVMVSYLGSLQSGVGSALMAEVEELARMSRVPVLLRSTPESAGFYKKLGYTCKNQTCRKSFSVTERVRLVELLNHPDAQ